jgi:hypothetical protein
MPEDTIPPFTGPAGKTLFIIEGSAVRILGIDGTEALVPLTDLGAFLDHLEVIYLDDSPSADKAEQRKKKGA